MCLAHATDPLLREIFTMATRRFDNRTRTTVIDYSDHPPVPYDLFLTLNHVIAYTIEHGTPPDAVSEIVETINDLFYLVEYDLSDLIPDLENPDVTITIETFFSRYGIEHDIWELDDDETTQSPVIVQHFPMFDVNEGDDSTISTEEEQDLVLETWIERNF